MRPAWIMTVASVPPGAVIGFCNGVASRDYRVPIILDIQEPREFGSEKVGAEVCLAEQLQRRCHLLERQGLASHTTDDAIREGNMASQVFAADAAGRCAPGMHVVVDDGDVG